MKDLKQFNIQFVGLKEGNHVFNFTIDNKFFEAFNFDDFINSSIEVSLTFVKKSTLFELVFAAKGTVEVPCDITSELYHQEIATELPLVVKFSQEFNDDNEEILILPHEAFQLNVAQFIYELIVLAIPTKRIHPKVVDGTIVVLKDLERALQSGDSSKVRELFGAMGEQRKLGHSSFKDC